MLDVLNDILHIDPWEVHVERLNLNVPGDARVKIKKLAKQRGVAEAELARELLLDALDRIEREEFDSRVREAQTPAVNDRQLKLLSAFERLDD